MVVKGLVKTSSEKQCRHLGAPATQTIVVGVESKIGEGLDGYCNLSRMTCQYLVARNGTRSSPR